MDFIETVQDSETVRRLGWTLLHTLWLGACVAAAFIVAMAAMRRRSANARYVAACVALGVMAALPVAVFLLVAPPPQPAPLAVVAAEVDIPLRSPDTGTAVPADPVASPRALSPAEPPGTTAGAPAPSKWTMPR